MLKSYRVVGWVGWVAHVILVSAQGPNPSFFFFWGTFIRLGGLLGQGLGLGLGPGLDNIYLSRLRKVAVLPSDPKHSEPLVSVWQRLKAFFVHEVEL